MRSLPKRNSNQLKKPARTSDQSLDENPLDILRKNWFRWLNKRIGVFGGALLTTCFALWFGWDTVSKLPGLSTAAATLQEWRGLPHSNGERFSIVLAQLENDSNGVHRGFIDDALRAHFNDQIEILRTPITISIAGDERPQEAVAEGHKKARSLLKKANVNVMIWGEALSAETRAPVRLHWTVNTESKTKKSTDKYLADQANYDLPALFWTDLDDVLYLVGTSQLEPFISQRGSYVANKLGPSIKRVESLLNKESESAVQQVELWDILAISLEVYGKQRGDIDALQESLRLYRALASGAERESGSLYWARMQLGLGGALLTVGEYQQNTALLDEAVVAHRNVLKVFTREKMPLGWAETQHNLGITLSILGRRKKDTQQLNEGVAAFHNALMEFTRERAPLNWAMTQHNLGNALLELGRLENSTVRLNEALAAYENALKERTHERVPLEWAVTQNNLGNTLQALGKRENSVARLNEAVVAFGNALKERTHEHEPLEWARTQFNLGNAFLEIGRHENSTARLNEAVAAYRNALKESTRERVPLEWARTQHNLGSTLWALGERENNMARLHEAIAAYRNALNEFSRERTPYEYNVTQKNLRGVQQIINKRQATEVLSTSSK